MCVRKKNGKNERFDIKDSGIVDEYRILMDLDIEKEDYDDKKNAYKYNR